MELKTSSVDRIIEALSFLENDMDKLDHRVNEMKKHIMTYSNEEIEKLRQIIIGLANEQANKLVQDARTNAEEEATTIAKEAENSILKIKNNIDSSFDKAVDRIIIMVLGEDISPKNQK